ncbi:MAG: DUF4179 domain-containing protein [Peptostreptococcaceae bacterium]
MSNKDLVDNIEVSDKLDDYILKGIERGRKEKRLVKDNKTMKATTKVASILIVGTVALGFVNPEIIRAIPIIGKAIESFDPSNFGSPTDKYVKYSKGMEIVSENKKAKVTLTDVMVDENECMIGVIVESEALRGYKGKNEGDFVNIDADMIELNGKSVDNQAYKASKINETTAGVIISSNIAQMKLGDKVDVGLIIRGINGETYINGKWDFKVEVDKVEHSNRINIDESYTVRGQELIIKEVVTSPVSSTVILGGTDDIESYPLQLTEFKVIDDKGNILSSNELGSSVDTTTGEFSGKISINSDLLNTKYIELIPYWEDDLIYKVIEDGYIPLLTTTGSGEREEVVISREPTKEELKSGYALSKVYYYLNLDKNKDFLSLEELIGYEIPVNSKEKVMIKDIEVNENGTKIIIKNEGEYNHLSELVLFDEEMNDIARWEGHIGAVLEDEKEQIYSITLDKIDTNKKYKIAVPTTKDIDFNSKEKIRVNL